MAGVSADVLWLPLMGSCGGRTGQPSRMAANTTPAFSLCSVRAVGRSPFTRRFLRKEVLLGDICQCKLFSSLLLPHVHKSSGSPAPIRCLISNIFHKQRRSLRRACSAESGREPSVNWDSTHGERDAETRGINDSEGNGRRARRWLDNLRNDTHFVGHEGREIHTKSGKMNSRRVVNRVAKTEAGDVERWNGVVDDASSPALVTQGLSWTWGFTRFIVKAFLLPLWFGSIIVISSFPSLLSWEKGRNSLLQIVNKAIPGTVEIDSMSLGWTKPAQLMNMRLKSPDGRSVLVVKSLTTDVSFLSMILHPEMLGGLRVDIPLIDLCKDEATGVPRLGLALMPAADSLTQKNGMGEGGGGRTGSQTPAFVDLDMSIYGDSSGVASLKGKVLMEADAAVLIGKKVSLQGWVGASALAQDHELKKTRAVAGGKPWELQPQILVVAKLETDYSIAGISGSMDVRSGRFQLARPIKCEARPTQAVGEILLSRVNPLLGFVVDPGLQGEDFPIIRVTVSPVGMYIPSTEYQIHIDPMRMVIARREFIARILDLLSADEQAHEGGDVTMMTSAADANLRMDGQIICSRMDLLIADSVHLATWGTVNWLNEDVSMILAVPHDTLKRIRGLSKVPRDYALQINLSGKSSNPQVQWSKLARQITELVVRQKAGVYGLLLFDKKEPDLPAPVGDLPWEPRR